MKQPNGRELSGTPDDVAKALSSFRGVVGRSRPAVSAPSRCSATSSAPSVHDAKERPPYRIGIKRNVDPINSRSKVHQIQFPSSIGKLLRINTNLLLSQTFI